MTRRLEQAIHDGCLALFTVGMIGTIWHVALGTLADQPIQHSNAQTMERVQ